MRNNYVNVPSFSIHRLKPLDIQVMKALHHKVNIVPIIAKADTLTSKEVTHLKQKVNAQSQKSIVFERYCLDRNKFS